jgi:hypothetical protein
MIHCREFIVLFFFSIVAFSQLSPTIALSERACIDMTLGFDPTERVDYSVLETLILDQCDGVNNCYVNLTSWSTNGLGGEKFTSMCSGVNRTTFTSFPFVIATDCSTFKVSYEGLHLCRPEGCESYDEEVWSQMLKKADFDGYCFEFSASSTPIPRAVIISIVVVLLLVCGGCCFYFVRRHAKSRVPTE